MGDKELLGQGEEEDRDPEEEEDGSEICDEVRDDNFPQNKFELVSNLSVVSNVRTKRMRALLLKTWRGGPLTPTNQSNQNECSLYITYPFSLCYSLSYKFKLLITRTSYSERYCL